MAKARRSAAKGSAKKRRRGTKARVKTKSKRAAVRKARAKKRPKGFADRVAGAVQVVTDTIQETSELRRRMGHRGGIDEG